MNDRRDPNGVELSRFERCLQAAVGIGLLLLLVSAAALEPDPRGYGTHQQLGWPPCGTRQMLGIRCPSCGMTTAWAHLTRGYVHRALATNVAGTLLGLAAIAAVPWLLASAARGRWFWRRPSPREAVMATAFVSGVAIVDWVVRFVVD